MGQCWPKGQINYSTSNGVMLSLVECVCQPQELQKKREEKRNEVKRKAEEEVKFLQASGKITKTPSHTGLGARKKTVGSKNGAAASRREQRSEGVTPRSEEEQGAAAGAVGGANPSLNDFLQVISLLP